MVSLKNIIVRGLVAGTTLGSVATTGVAGSDKGIDYISIKKSFYEILNRNTDYEILKRELDSWSSVSFDHIGGVISDLKKEIDNYGSLNWNPSNKNRRIKELEKDVSNLEITIGKLGMLKLDLRDSLTEQHLVQKADSLEIISLNESLFKYENEITSLRKRLTEQEKNSSKDKPLTELREGMENLANTIENAYENNSKVSVIIEGTYPSGVSLSVGYELLHLGIGVSKLDEDKNVESWSTSGTSSVRPGYETTLVNSGNETSKNIGLAGMVMTGIRLTDHLSFYAIGEMATRETVTNNSSTLTHYLDGKQLNSREEHDAPEIKSKLEINPGIGASLYLGKFSFSGGAIKRNGKYKPFVGVGVTKRFGNSRNHKGK